MGSNIAPLIAPFQVPTTLPRGEVVAIDGNNAVMQAMTKSIAGTAMGTWRDRAGNPVAHLYGILNRTTGILQAGAWPLFVFDGKATDAKQRKDYDRIKAYTNAQRNITRAQHAVDMQYATWLKDRPAYFWPKVFREVRDLLAFLGCPYLPAPGEGEAQAAFLCMIGAAAGVISQDYDTLLFGSPRLYRRLQGPKATYGEIRLNHVLCELRISREQLVDVSILAGNDFHPGIEGIGPRMALKLIQLHGSIESIPTRVKERYDFSALPPDKIEQVRRTFLAPDICTDVPKPAWRAPSREHLLRLCCHDHHLSEQRVSRAVDRWIRALRHASLVPSSRFF